jgi:hypothetical protein
MATSGNARRRALARLLKRDDLSNLASCVAATHRLPL